MDDYRIPTTDGRYVTLRYDKVTRQMMINFPPPAEGADADDEASSTFGFTVDDARDFVEALSAVRAQAAEDASRRNGAATQHDDPTG